MNKKNFLKNIISSLALQICVLLYGFIVPIFIIKQYGSETNGLVSSITQFLAYITLLEAGIGPIIKNALFKPIVKKDVEKIKKILGATNRFFKKIAYAFIFYLIILCFVYPQFINSNFSTCYTLSLIIIIFISRFFEYFIGITYKMFLQADQKNYIVDYLSCFSYIINLVLIVILIKLECSIQVVKLISAFVYVLKSLYLKVYFERKYGYKIKNDNDYKLEKQWDGVAHHIASTVQNNTDVVVLSIFRNLTEVSIYSVYSLIINGIRSIIVSLTNGVDAFFGKLMIYKSEEEINQKFTLYTFIFYTITTILLSCCLFLSVPFISIYTKEINDANYIQPIFAYILIFAEFNYIIRYPYSTIVYAKGHFKETRNFSIAEPIINIVLSVLLVQKYGLIGVAIGTLISMSVRSFGFIIYASKKILKINIKESLKLIFLSLFEMLIYFFVHLYIGNIIVNSYFKWFLLSLLVFVIISIITIIINCLLYRKIFKRIINLFFERKIKK